jgi:hypothetical protein
MNETLTLYDYVKSKNITMQDFSVLTGISASFLRSIQKNRDANISVDNASKIYHATAKEFGEGLDYHQYLNK